MAASAEFAVAVAGRTCNERAGKAATELGRPRRFRPSVPPSGVDWSGEEKGPNARVILGHVLSLLLCQDGAAQLSDPFGRHAELRYNSRCVEYEMPIYHVLAQRF